MIICDNEDFKEAAEFYAERLGIPDTAIVVVSLHHNIPVAGYCEYHDEEALPYALVGIDIEEYDDAEDPIAVLAHEMVHVKQYFKGELIDDGRQASWHGKLYQEFEPNSEEYFFSPWEVEAYGMQVGLYRLYCRSVEE